MNWEQLKLLLEVSEKLRGLPAYGNLLQLVTIEIGEMEAEAKAEVLDRTEQVKKAIAAPVAKAEEAKEPEVEPTKDRR